MVTFVYARVDAVVFAPDEVRNDDDASVNREAVRDRHELADHDD